MPTLFITGASSGIGAACARHLAAQGWEVFGTSRGAPPPEGAQRQALGKGCLTLFRMDVDDDDSVSRGIAWVLGQGGRLDAVVNCAGFALTGAVEDTTPAEARAQFQTNLFGVVRVLHAVLPHLRRQGAGHIVNIGSLAGTIAVPFHGYYSASKFALAGLTEALRLELMPFGLGVSLIEPGDFRTPFTQHRRRALAAQGEGAYRALFDRALAVTERDEGQGPDPTGIARLLERILASANPRLRYRVGPGHERLAVWLKCLLPAPLFEWGLRRYYRLHRGA